MLKSNMCYCYNDDCNQKEWENQGRTGKRQWCLISSLWVHSLFGEKQPVPKCPYCKKEMTITANFEDTL